MTPIIFAGLPEKQQHFVKFNIKLHQPDEIILAICEIMDLKYDDVVSVTRTRELVIARQIAIALIYYANPLIPLTKIGNMFGGRHHSTILYSIEQYKDLYGRDVNFTKIVDRIKIITGTKVPHSGKLRPAKRLLNPIFTK